MNIWTSEQYHVAMKRFTLSASDLTAGSPEAFGCPAPQTTGSDPSVTVV